MGLLQLPSMQGKMFYYRLNSETRIQEDQYHQCNNPASMVTGTPRKWSIYTDVMYEKVRVFRVSLIKCCYQPNHWFRNLPNRQRCHLKSHVRRSWCWVREPSKSEFRLRPIRKLQRDAIQDEKPMQFQKISMSESISSATTTKTPKARVTQFWTNAFRKMSCVLLSNEVSRFSFPCVCS